MRRRPFPLTLMVPLVLAGCADAAVQSWLEPVEGARCTWQRAEGVFFNDLLPPEGAPTNTRGDVLRIQELPAVNAWELGRLAGMGRPAPHGARVFRLLYLSQAPAGVPRVVSARLAVPDVPLRADAVLVVRGHGTTGMSDNSAPSLEPGLGFQQPGNPFTAALLARGHAAIQTDYAGLGTHGKHPYMILEAHAWGVLDSMRAAFRLCDGAGVLPADLPRRVLMEGHSQGGHAILGALQFLDGDDPGGHVLGAVLFAPGAEPSELAVRALSSETSRLLTPIAMSLVTYAEYHPGLVNLDDIFVPSRRALADLVHRLPAPALAPYTTDRPELLFTGRFIRAVTTRDLANPVVAALRPVDMENTPGNFRSHVPMLLVHGTADDLIPVDVTDMLQERMCSRGNRVRRLEVDGATHGGVLKAAQADALDWVDARVAGLEEPGACPAR